MWAKDQIFHNENDKRRENLVPYTLKDTKGSKDVTTWNFWRFI